MPTKIEWATESWNPITGCTKVSAGCQNCYAERMAKRLAGRYGYPKDDPFRVTYHPDRLDIPLMWKKSRRIFVCSMSDFFGAKLEWMCDIFRVIRECPQHKFLILTKRIDQLANFNEACGWPADLTNIWLGVSVEDQKAADERIPILLNTECQTLFVSCEPLLGPIEFSAHGGIHCPDALGLIDWIIVGGESGPKARQMNPEWARSIRDQCQAAGTPFFMKQMSKKAPIPGDLMIREFPQ